MNTLTNISDLLNNPTDIATGMLEDFVHDAAYQASSDANGGGVEDQIHFLIAHGWSIKRILNAFNECLGEEEIQEILGQGKEE